jgi:predicted transposase/invertase (TIGR01784 family)
MGRDLLPVKDLLFKKMLSSEQHKDVCKGFICDMLGIEVKDLEFNSPYDIRTLAGTEGTDNTMRHSEVDVRVRLTDGRQVIVEMQRRNHESWALRALYYPASSFTSTLGMHEAGASHIQNYVALCPTHGISVLDFTCFPKDTEYMNI